MALAYYYKAIIMTQLIRQTWASNDVISTLIRIMKKQKKPCGVRLGYASHCTFCLMKRGKKNDYI